jgi:NADPH:quinone reductase-like Zn-dependent oxidoreductase
MPRPGSATPGLCDVLVKVAACGITHNELDWPIWTCRAGHQRTAVIPGHEVFGLTDQFRDGAAAEYVAVEARNVAPKPHTADHVQAAAVPRAGLTAWQALFDHGKLTRGQTVIIHGAGGAVGSTAVQLASRTQPARPTWCWTRSAARCSPARPPSCGPEER